MFEIKTGIPIPEPNTSNRGSHLKYPFDKMAPQQSFDVPIKPDETPKRVADRVRNLAAGWAKRKAPARRFTVRVVTNDAGAQVVRVWRIDDRTTN